MTSRRIPRYTLHRPTGQARVRIEGKDYYLGRWGSPESKARYDALIADWLGGKLNVSPRQPEADAAVTALTVADVLGLYLEHARGYYRDRGRHTGQVDRIIRMMRVVTARVGTLAAVALGPRSLKDCRQDMIALGWSRGYVNSCIGCLVRAWSWAVSEELAPAESAQALREVAPLRAGEQGVREGRTVLPVPWSQVEVVLPLLQPAVCDLLTVQYLTGMRPIEACHLRGQDIYRDGRLPDGSSFPGVWVYVVPPEANKMHWKGRKRIIFLGPRAQTILQPYLERRQPQEYLFSPRESRAQFEVTKRAARKTPCYPSHMARNAAKRKPRPKRSAADRYVTHALQTALRRACLRAGVPHFSPNQIRHARATELRALDGIAAAGAVLGHKTLETTLIYAEESLQRAAEAMRRVG